MSSCRPSTQRPLPASPATRRGRLDVALSTLTKACPVATLKACDASIVALTPTGVAIVEINPDEVGAP